MIEIVPNWHPVLVHFTVALWSLAAIFNLVTPFLSEGKIKHEWQILSRWSLWLGTGCGVLTALAGWFAYNSVLHDTPSHAAMTEHRNWALMTLGMFILLTIWSVWSEYNRRSPGKLFLAVLLLGGGLLTGSAWRGAEVVYRHGIGVMSLPAAEDRGQIHHPDGQMGGMEHHHMQGSARTDSDNENTAAEKSIDNHDHAQHEISE